MFKPLPMKFLDKMLDVFVSGVTGINQNPDMIVECFEAISKIVENCAEANLRIMKNLDFLKSVNKRALTLNDNFYFDIIVNLFDSILMAGDEL